MLWYVRGEVSTYTYDTTTIDGFIPLPTIILYNETLKIIDFLNNHNALFFQ